MASGSLFLSATVDDSDDSDDEAPRAINAADLGGGLPNEDEAAGQAGAGQAGQFEGNDESDFALSEDAAREYLNEPGPGPARRGGGGGASSRGGRRRGGGGGGGGGYRGDGQNGQNGGGQTDGVEGDLGGAGDAWVGSRLLTDEAALTPEEEQEDAGECFICAYKSHISSLDPDVINQPGFSGDRERMDAYTSLVQDIESYIERKCPPRLMCRLIKESYDAKCRPLCNFGEWTKKSIYLHVFQHLTGPAAEQLLLDDMTRLYNAKIEYLRSNLLKRNRDTGEIETQKANFVFLQKAHRERLHLYERQKRLRERRS